MVFEYFPKSFEKIQVPLKSDKSNRHFTWRPIHIFKISRSFRLRMRNVSDKILGKIKTHIIYSTAFFFENRTVYEIRWKNNVEQGKPQKTIWRMSVECWLPKATNTYTEYLILIVFLLLQWLKNAPLSYVTRMYIACLVLTCIYLRV